MANDYRFYSGGYSSLSPNYGNFIGYRLNSSAIGSPTGIQTANQVNEVVSRIREGVKNVEIQAIQPEVFEQIPQQHFEEMSQVARLAGVKTSVHAPIIDPAGFGERGYEGEKARIDSEARLWNVIEKAHELDKNGKVPIVMHSTAGIPGSSYKPGNVSPGEKGRFQEQKIILINQETKELVPLEEERKFYPGGRTTKEEFAAGRKDIELGGTLRVPRDDIETLNVTDWDNKISNLAVYKKNAIETIGDAALILAPRGILNQPNIKEVRDNLTEEEKIALNKLENASLFLDNVRMSFNSIFHKAYKYGTPEQRKEMERISEDYEKEMKSWYVKDKQGHLIGDQNGRPIEFINAPLRQMEVLDKSIHELHELASTPGGAPQIFKPVEDFAMEKAAETFGNLAFRSAKEYKENAPFLAIENMYQGMAFSRAEDMEKLIEASRERFKQQAVKSIKDGGLGLKEKDAEKRAEQMIGMTLDVGHLNMMRKSGFTKEDVIAEAGKMGKLVKHVHLTDNFGYSDSHLPPGMGNVPTRQILEQLEKAGKLKDGRFTEARAIVEAGAFVQHFKKSPYTHVLSAFGSPIYGPGRPNYTGVMDMQGGYFGSPLAYLPEKHFATYGSGFSGLPTELGGQMPGTQSRFSGTPNS